MRKRLTPKISLLLLFLTAIIVCVIVACDSKMLRMGQGEVNPTVSQVSPLSLMQEPVATKIVSHALGQVEIPLYPQRIVVLDSSFLLDPLLALDINPIGIATCTYCISSDSLGDLLSKISIVGHWEHPSLEKILSLKPDLIIGHIWQRSFYPLLSAIAPTVLIDTDSEVDFKKNLKYLAELLDKNSRAEEVLAEYNERIQNFRQQLGESLKTKTVSIVHLFSSSSMAVYGSDIVPYAQIMNNAGIQFIPAYKTLQGYLGISIETLPDWDADILFIVILHERDSKNLKSLSFLEQPIWSTLKAVKNNQVHVVSWASTVVGPITANQFIDELYQYFIETP
jgi:iron complex transport system substrate-binding protein